VNPAPHCECDTAVTSPSDRGAPLSVVVELDPYGYGRRNRIPALVVPALSAHQGPKSRPSTPAAGRAVAGSLPFRPLSVAIRDGSGPPRGRLV
jgi:hypothetical protein